MTIDNRKALVSTGTRLEYAVHHGLGASMGNSNMFLQSCDLIKSHTQFVSLQTRHGVRSAVKLHGDRKVNGVGEGASRMLTHPTLPLAFGRRQSGVYFDPLYSRQSYNLIQKHLPGLQQSP